MNKRLDARLKMFDSTDEVLTQYADDWAGYVPMVMQVEVFRGQRDAINATKQAQETDLKGIAEDKHVKRGTMADKAMQICDKVKGWCYQMGDIIGFGEMHITRTMIMNGRSSNAQSLCQRIYDKADGMTAAERITFNITNDDMIGLVGAISAYNAVKVSPRTAVACRKSDTDSFKKLFKNCTLTLKMSIDNLMADFRGTQFYADYFNARRIADEATQKATLTVTVVSEYDGEPLAGVMVTGTDGVKQFEEMTDVKGRVKRYNIKPEVWGLSCVLTNYETVNMQTDVYAGDKDKVLVKMRPVPN